MLNPWFVAVLSVLFVPSARAQSPHLRLSDTRTTTPETVMSGKKDWGLELFFGGNFTRGNVDIDYLGSGFSLFKAWPQLTGYLSGSMVYNKFGGRRVLNQGSLTARLDRAWKDSWKIFAYHTNAYNEFLRLNQRTTSGAGPWYDLTLGPTTHGLSLALTHEYERFKGGRIENAARLSWRSLSEAPLSRAAKLRADFFYVPKLDDAADYHLFVEVGLQSLIWKDNVGLKVSWVNEYDSRPKPGVKYTDTLWLTSLTLRFGR